MTTVNEAGRLGGLSVLKKYGISFYSNIGRKGQETMRQKYPKNASSWGKLGGRPKKPPLIDAWEGKTK